MAPAGLPLAIVVVLLWTIVAVLATGSISQGFLFGAQSRRGSSHIRQLAPTSQGASLKKCILSLACQPLIEVRQGHDAAAQGSHRRKVRSALWNGVHIQAL